MQRCEYTVCIPVFVQNLNPRFPHAEEEHKHYDGARPQISGMSHWSGRDCSPGAGRKHLAFCSLFGHSAQVFASVELRPGRWTLSHWGSNCNATALRAARPKVSHARTASARLLTPHFHILTARCHIFFSFSWTTNRLPLFSSFRSLPLHRLPLCRSTWKVRFRRQSAAIWCSVAG